MVTCKMQTFFTIYMIFCTLEQNGKNAVLRRYFLCYRDLCYDIVTRYPGSRTSMGVSFSLPNKSMNRTHFTRKA